MIQCGCVRLNFLGTSKKELVCVVGSEERHGLEDFD